MTQRELSRVTGIDQAVISRVESGRAEGTVEFWRAVSTALNAPVSEFIGSPKDISDLPDDVIQTAQLMKSLPHEFRMAIQSMVKTLTEKMGRRG